MGAVSTFKPNDYYKHVYNELATYVQKVSITGYIDGMKYIQHNVYSITDNKI